MKHELQKVTVAQLQEQRKKKKNQKLTLNSPLETKNIFKNIEQVEIYMDSTATIKKHRPPLAKLEEYI